MITILWNSSFSNWSLSSWALLADAAFCSYWHHDIELHWGDLERVWKIIFNQNHRWSQMHDYSTVVHEKREGSLAHLWWTCLNITQPTLDHHEPRLNWYNSSLILIPELEQSLVCQNTLLVSACSSRSLLANWSDNLSTLASSLDISDINLHHECNVW